MAILACVARVTVCRERAKAQRPTHRKVRRDSVKRIKRKIRKYITGKLTKEELLKSLQSWTGHAEHADSYNLRAKINALARTASGKGAGE